METLPLNLFSKLSNDYSLRSEDASSISSVDDFISQSISEPLLSTEDTFYSKLKGKVLIGDKQCLRYYELAMGSEKPSRAKRTKKAHCNTPKIVGASLSEGFDLYSRPTDAEVYSLEDLFVVIDEDIKTAHGCKQPKDEQKDKQKDEERQDKDKEKCLVTMRRNLLLLMLLPLNSSSEYTFNVIRWGKYTILDYAFEGNEELVDVLTKSLAKLSTSSNTADDLLCYTGIRFEQVVTSQQDEKDEANGSSFYTVTSHRVNKHKVKVVAEIDAASKTEQGLRSYIELKTHNATASLDYKLSKKLMRTWCQTRLIGGCHVSVGFRKKTLNEKNTYSLSGVKYYKTNEIPSLIHSQGCKVSTRVDNKEVVVTCQKLLRWYQCVVNWIATKVDAPAKVDGLCEKAAVFRLRYANEELTMEGCSESAAKQVVEQRIPGWFKEKHFA